MLEVGVPLGSVVLVVLVGVLINITIVLVIDPNNQLEGAELLEGLHQEAMEDTAAAE